MRKFAEFIVMWETATKDGYSYRMYSRRFDNLAAATALYLSKRRDQYPRLFQNDRTEIRPAYTDENGIYHTAFIADRITILREYGN